MLYSKYNSVIPVILTLDPELGQRESCYLCSSNKIEELTKMVNGFDWSHKSCRLKNDVESVCQWCGLTIVTCI